MADEIAADIRQGQRIAKVIARAGLCSRREAEAWIAAGRVALNGKVIDTPACIVGPNDDVRVDGQRLAPPERTRLFLYHKPRGLVTTTKDPEGRPTIFAALPHGLPRLVSIGRLDINTEGLMLLTNDGGLARVLELPATGWLRRYRVRALGTIDQARLDALGAGVTVDGVAYGAIEATLDRQQGSNVWITMGLREGKNREIKNVLTHLGLTVNRLIRVSFGPFQLGALAEGDIQETPTQTLRERLGAKLAKESGANFDAPLIHREEASARDHSPARPDSRREPRRPGGGRAPFARPQQSRRDDKEPNRRPPEPSDARAKHKRKHVSVLRAERSEETGRLRRTKQPDARDSKGRAVAVEKISLARADAPKAEKSAKGRRGSRGASAVRGDGAARGKGRAYGEGRASGSETREAPRGRADDRAPRRGRAFGQESRGEKREQRERTFAPDGDMRRKQAGGRPQDRSDKRPPRKPPGRHGAGPRRPPRKR